MRITERRAERSFGAGRDHPPGAAPLAHEAGSRGALGVVGLGALVLLLSAYGLESWRFSPASIITFRIILGVALAGLVGYLLVRPLMRARSDEQVALYLEEHEPSLQAAIISAVEASRRAAADNSPHSATLVRRLVESAVEKCEAIDTGPRRARAGAPLRPRRSRSSRSPPSRSSRSVPRTSATRCRRCFVLSRHVEAAAPYRIEVTPGNATVPRGADQTITASSPGSTPSRRR